jgi:N-acetylglutamate synthase-like GNAT family acetyltransferase
MIRELTAADVPEVFALRVSTLENTVTMQELEEEYGLTPETLAEAMQHSAKGWVCEVEGKIVGFAMGDCDTGEMTVLAVLPGFEKRGIGKQLLERVQDWLFKSGHEELWLLTTPDPTFRAYGFYQAQGWVATGELVDEEEEKFVLPRV